jgi:hypothetical protein
MSEPLPSKRPRAPIAISLAIMLIACFLIVTALVLIAQGAVARDSGAGRPLPEDGSVSARIDPTPGETSPTTAAGAIEGRFVLGRAPTPAERELAARIAESSTGGGVAIGDEIRVVIDEHASESEDR